MMDRQRSTTTSDITDTPTSYEPTEQVGNIQVFISHKRSDGTCFRLYFGQRHPFESYGVP